MATKQQTQKILDVRFLAQAKKFCDLNAASVSELVRDTCSTIIYLQETKLQVIDDNVVRHTSSQQFVNNYAVLPAVQTRGGILLAVAENFFALSNIHLTTHAITATVSMRADDTKWQITVVYGPQGDNAKLQFLQELKSIPRPYHGRWLILGDFNLIYQAEDKNNTNLNRRLMGCFKAAIDTLFIKEIRLNGRRYTLEH